MCHMGGNRHSVRMFGLVVMCTHTPQRCPVHFIGEGLGERLEWSQGKCLGHKPHVLVCHSSGGWDPTSRRHLQIPSGENLLHGL